MPTLNNRSTRAKQRRHKAQTIEKRQRLRRQAERAEPKEGKIREELIYQTILDMCVAAGPDGYIRPEIVAMTLLPHDWQSLLKRIRIAAKKLGEGGAVVILRKGQPADPEDFKGIYRLRIAQ